jgi:dTDP-4-amino-4,6-dideoxygalactose transaminase
MKDTELPFFGIAASLQEEAHWLTTLPTLIAESDFQVQGPQTLALEQELGQELDIEHCVAVGSGTDALVASLLALGVGPGQEVLVPAVSFVASASCVLMVGAKPVFVDVLPWQGGIDPDDLSRKVTSKTAAIIAVSLFGQGFGSAQSSALKKLGIPIIEDCAQSLGSINSQGERAGALGGITCLSFDPTKILNSLGSGGAILTKSAEVAETVRRWRFHGRDSQGRFSALGRNSQLAECSAAFLRMRLTKIRELIAQRKQVANLYEREIEKLPGLSSVCRTEGPAAPAWQKFVILTDRRLAIAQALKAAGIDTKPQYGMALPEEPLFREFAGKHCPGAAEFCRRALGLPIYPAMLKKRETFNWPEVFSQSIRGL